MQSLPVGGGGLWGKGHLSHSKSHTGTVMRAAPAPGAVWRPPSCIVSSGVPRPTAAPSRVHAPLRGQPEPEGGHPPQTELALCLLQNTLQGMTRCRSQHLPPARPPEAASAQVKVPQQPFRGGDGGPSCFPLHLRSFLPEASPPPPPKSQARSAPLAGVSHIPPLPTPQSRPASCSPCLVCTGKGRRGGVRTCILLCFCFPR